MRIPSVARRRLYGAYLVARTRRPRAASPSVEGERTDWVRLTLRLRRATEPISGLLESEDATTEFAGLLELVSLLDVLRQAREEEPACLDFVP